VLAVSSAYTLEQLRLLLGIAAAAELSVTGLVDAAVAAAAGRPSLPG
jgi:shikimate kinase